jgi:hypothetical protein
MKVQTDCDARVSEFLGTVRPFEQCFRLPRTNVGVCAEIASSLWFCAEHNGVPIAGGPIYNAFHNAPFAIAGQTFFPIKEGLRMQAGNSNFLNLEWRVQRRDWSRVAT